MKKSFSLINLLASGILCIPSLCNASQEASASPQNTTAAKSSTSNETLPMLTLTRQVGNDKAQSFILKLKPSAQEKEKEEKQKKEAEKSVPVLDKKEAHVDQPYLFDTSYNLGKVFNIHSTNVKDTSSVILIRKTLTLGKEFYDKMKKIGNKVKQDKEDKIGLESILDFILKDSIDVQLLTNKEYRQQINEKKSILQDTYPSASKKWLALEKENSIDTTINKLVDLNIQFNKEASPAAQDALKKTLIQLKVTNVESLLKQFEPIK